MRGLRSGYEIPPQAMGYWTVHIEVEDEHGAIGQTAVERFVTTDEQRREVWIYDKISSDRVDSARSVYGTIIILGGSRSSSSSSSTQRTLTIIIKYDEQKKVRDFAYNYSSF